MNENEEREIILHPDRQGLRMVLGDLEAAVMDVIWRGPEGGWCTVRDVYETMRTERQIAYTTVMNTMTRLAKKGLLETTRRDMAYLYRPVQSRDGFIERVVGHVLERLLVQFTGPTKTALADLVGRDAEQSARVEGLLEDIERRRSVRAARTEGEEEG